MVFFYISSILLLVDIVNTRSGAKKPGYVTRCMYVGTWFEISVESITRPNIRTV